MSICANYHVSQFTRPLFLNLRDGKLRGEYNPTCVGLSNLTTKVQNLKFKLFYLNSFYFGQLSFIDTKSHTSGSSSSSSLKIVKSETCSLILMTEGMEAVEAVEAMTLALNSTLVLTISSMASPHLSYSLDRTLGTF